MRNPLSLSELTEVAERIRGIEHRVRTDDEVSALLAKLGENQQSFGLPPSFKPCWSRVCRLGDEEKLTNLRRLIYPPNPPDAAGRANLKGQTVFYAASNLRVACDEIESQQGDRIGVITVRQRPDRMKPTVIVGEVEAILNSGTSVLRVAGNEDDIGKLLIDDPDDLAKAHFADSVMAQLFRRTDKQYQATALFSNNIYRQGFGVVFPSVRTPWGVNIALLADHFNTHYEVVLAQEYTVTRYYGHSQYSYESRGASCTFASDGTINWLSSQELPHTWSIQRGRNVSASFVGWRVPVK